MLEKLTNYERVDSIEDVPLKTHVRYVTLSKILLVNKFLD